MLLQELDEDKNLARHYVLGNEYIGLDHNYYLTDEQGSVRYVLDAAGNVQNDYRYDAFGQRIAGQENIPNRLRYNAQIEDDLTGLYYLRARYYNTGIGRFTQEDVIYNDGLNLYAYCNSNPVMYSDPSGFAKRTCKSKVGGECGSETNYGKSSDKINWEAVVSKKTGETRVEHVKLHESNDLSKLSHGVFYGNSQNTINNAWKNKSNGIKISEGNTDMYIIPYENAGYSGGLGGQGNNLNTVTIITQKGTNNIITGFPGNGYRYALNGLIGGN